MDKAFFIKEDMLTCSMSEIACKSETKPFVLLSSTTDIRFAFVLSLCIFAYFIN